MAEQSQCSICLEMHPLHALLWIRCGHGYCSLCITKYIQMQPAWRTEFSCPYCRGPFGRQEPHRIIITHPQQSQPQLASRSGVRGRTASSYSEAVLQQAGAVAKKIGKMGPRTPGLKLQRAGLDIKKLVDEIEPAASDNVRKLLEAVAGFLGRISPILNKLIEQEKELREAEQLLDEAIDSADQATSRSNAVHAENERLKNQNHVILLEKEGLLNTQRDEIVALRCALQSHQDEAHAQTDATSMDAIRRGLMEREIAAANKLAKHFARTASGTSATRPLSLVSAFEGHQDLTPQANPPRRFSMFSDAQVMLGGIANEQRELQHEGPKPKRLQKKTTRRDSGVLLS